MSKITEVTTKFKPLEKMLLPVIICNVLALAFSLPGIIKFSEMVLGPNERDFYDLNETTQCVRSESGLKFKGNWFEWLRASVILTSLVSILNIGAIFLAGTDKPGESDSLFSKLSILFNMINITVVIIISFILFTSVNLVITEPPVEETATEVITEEPVVGEEVVEGVVEGYQQLENNGDYCFSKLFKNQGIALKIFLGIWISFYGLGIVFTLLAIRPISVSEVNKLVQSQQQMAKSQLLI